MDEIPKPKETPELPSYALDEEEISSGWRPWLRGWRLALLITLASLLAAVGLGAKPLYREMKTRRAIALAEQSGDAIDRGDGAAASALLRQAALMAYGDDRVESLVVYHAARAGDMASVAKLGQKIADGKASAQEILVFGERSLGANQIEDADRALSALPADLSGREATRAVMLRAGVLRAQSKTTEAKNVLREAVARIPSPEVDTLRLGLANWLLSEDADKDRAEAEVLLEAAARSNSPDGAAALRLMAASRAQHSQPLDEVAARLRAHPASNPSDELLLARLFAADPAHREDATKNLAVRMKDRNASLDDRVAAARWLIGVEAYQSVLDLISPEEPSSHAGALMARLDALAGLKHWEECAKLVDANRGGTVPDTLYYLLNARMAQERGEARSEEENKRALRQALTHANARHVLFAARYAETCGWKPEAYAAWRILANDDSYAVEALRGELRNLPQAMPAEDAAELATELLARQPNDSSVRLSAAYYRLMAGKEVKSSAETAEELLAAEPQSVDVRRVVALARLRTDRGNEGLAIWPGDDTEDRWRALHVALLRSASQDEQADELAKSVDMQKLSIEERDLLRPQ